MKKTRLRTAVCVLLAGTVLTAFVALAADAGGQGDPLVTLSYLNETFLGQILTRVDEKLAERDQKLSRDLEEQINQVERELMGQGGIAVDGVAAVYSEVTLNAGETLWGEMGCEVLLRSGSAVCVSEGSTPGLVDTTGGGSINNRGALQKDHLYLMTAQRGVEASDQVTLLVRGEFTVG